MIWYVFVSVRWERWDTLWDTWAPQMKNTLIYWFIQKLTGSHHMCHKSMRNVVLTSEYCCRVHECIFVAAGGATYSVRPPLLHSATAPWLFVWKCPLQQVSLTPAGLQTSAHPRFQKATQKTEHVCSAPPAHGPSPAQAQWDDHMP